MRFAFVLFVLCLMTMLFGCQESKMNAYTSVQTSGAGDKLEPVTFTSNPSAAADTFCIDRTLTKQKSQVLVEHLPSQVRNCFLVFLSQNEMR